MATTPLTQEERETLLKVARASIAEAVGDAPVPEAAPDPALQEPRGAFVTLRRLDGELRGCVGTFHPRTTLLDTVREMARAAALDDPRFPPVRKEELKDLHIDISVLSPLEPSDARHVEVGIHGVCVQRGFRRGVLLPQVAVEEGWDADSFLDHTCMKAGLPPGAWRDPETTISTFTAEVFEEK